MGSRCKCVTVDVSLHQQVQVYLLMHCINEWKKTMMKTFFDTKDAKNRNLKNRKKNAVCVTSCLFRGFLFSGDFRVDFAKSRAGLGLFNYVFSSVVDMWGTRQTNLRSPHPPTAKRRNHKKKNNIQRSFPSFFGGCFVCFGGDETILTLNWHPRIKKQGKPKETREPPPYFSTIIVGVKWLPALPSEGRRAGGAPSSQFIRRLWLLGTYSPASGLLCSTDSVLSITAVILCVDFWWCGKRVVSCRVVSWKGTREMRFFSSVSRER